MNQKKVLKKINITLQEHSVLKAKDLIKNWGEETAFVIAMEMFNEFQYIHKSGEETKEKDVVSVANLRRSFWANVALHLGPK